MKYAILSSKRSRNLGDHVQLLAAKQFLPRVDYQLDMALGSASEHCEPTKMILNGWFSRDPHNWTPPPHIVPLFIGFHVTRHARADTILTRPELAGYYRAYQPIGCRDHHTERLFQKIGIKAYLSGCLTLTLQSQVRERHDSTAFVDVPFSADHMRSRARIGKSFLKQMSERFKRRFRTRFRAQPILEQIPDRVMERATFVTHWNPDPPGHDVRYEKAQALLELYAKAKFVITSRLHCALPCLAYGTPVLFVKPPPSIWNLAGDDPRFAGLIELLNHCSWNDLVAGRVEIDWDDPKPNPVEISDLVVKLRKTCEEFVGA